MLQHEKSEIIQECIDHLEKNYPTGLAFYPEATSGFKTAIETLEKLKTEVDALAEQEAEQMAEELTTAEEYKLMKEGRFTQDAIDKGEIRNVDEGKLGYLGVGVEETYEEHERNNYRSEGNRFSS